MRLLVKLVNAGRGVIGVIVTVDHSNARYRCLLKTDAYDCWVIAPDAVSHWKGNMVPDQIQDGLRPLRLEEESFIRALLRRARDGEHLLVQLEHAQVLDINDGKMGSVQFAGHDIRFLGSCLVKAQYVDRDGIPVSIVLNTDTTGQLYELDIWKADFSSLQAYPVFERMTIKA